MTTSLKIALGACCIFNMHLAWTQQVTCIDTVTRSVFFFRLRYKMPKGIERNESPMFDKAYSFDVSRAKRMSIDEIYSLYKYKQTDTVKYLTYLGTKNVGIEQYVSYKNCLDTYRTRIKIEGLINPVHYVRLKPVTKYDKGTKMGLSLATVKWLHIQVTDDLANNAFNEPPTLDLPHAHPKQYDIYLPLEVIRMDNNVEIINRFVVLKQDETL
jgi:hypothetical protein